MWEQKKHNVLDGDSRLDEFIRIRERLKVDDAAFCAKLL